MNTKIFDGRAFAAKKEKELKKSIFSLKKKRINPKLVVIYVGSNPASEIYINKKKKAAERIGCDLEVIKLTKGVPMIRIIDTVNRLNTGGDVHGIMLQLPLPESFSHKERDKIINSLDKKKDVDGMRNDSPFLAPVAKAVICVLKEVSKELPYKVAPLKVVVVGCTGFEGRKIYKVLKEIGYEVSGVDIKTKNLKERTKSADIIISVTGVPGLIKESMVKEGCVLIDVGAPGGDVDKNAYRKASFVTPVPGGIGPVTIVSLLENLIEACTLS